MSRRPLDARILVVRMWREPADGIRLTIVDRVDLPPAQRQTIAVASVDAGLAELRRILRAFESRDHLPSDLT